MKQFPLEALDQHVAVLGKTRSGKSTALRGVVEGLLARQQPVCIVDPKGDWWGIKLAADGRGPGFPVVIFGGDHADVPINAHAGAHVAELFATGNRPCLIDLGGWMVGERTRFWIDFSSSLFRFTRGRRWLVVDEIHNFAPKGKVFDPDAGKALHWAMRLASEGLGKGISMLFASQRPQKVHNDVLTSAETLVAMRVLHPSDRKAVAEWIDGCGDPALGSEVLKNLAQMDRGEGYVWSPEAKFGPELVRFPMFTTYDSFRPQSAADEKRLKGWAEVDLDDVRAKMAGVIQKAAENDPAILRNEIVRLRKELRAKDAERPAPPAKPVEVRIEVPILDDAHFKRLREACEQLETHAATVRELLTWAKDLMAKLRAPAPAFRITKAASPAASRPVSRVQSSAESSGGDGALSIGERKVLSALIQYQGGLEPTSLTTITGYKRSTRDAYLRRLMLRGYVERAGDRVVATASGVAVMPHVEPLPTGDELARHCLERLPEGERRILAALLDAGGGPVTRDGLGEVSGYKRSTRDAYIQRLAARELVESVGAGDVQVSAMLRG